MMPPLTKRQAELLRVIKTFYRKNGYMPSLEEMAKRMKVSSLSTIHEHLENIENKGYICREMNAARGITLMDEKESFRVNVIKSTKRNTDRYGRIDFDKFGKDVLNLLNS
jgi:SOS-response transcriptional repressor LexA